MTLDNFRQSLTEAKPPAELTLALVGLWWDAKGNAAYWYGRAGNPACREPLDAEWLSIVRELLG